MALLDGLRVVQLGGGLAAGYATKLLADAGADVVKVEPRRGDPLRTWSAPHHACEPTVGGRLFQYVSSSKRSIVGEIGEAEVDRLLARADVIVDEQPGSVASRREIGVSQGGPVVVSITPFGTRGPWADRPWTEFTLQASCGSIASRGLPEREPLATAGRLGEWLAGSLAAFLAAVATIGPQPCAVTYDVSLFECMCIGTVSFPQVRASMGQRRPPDTVPRSLELPSVEPCADGHVGFATITAVQFESFLHLIGRSDLVDDRGLAGAANRQRRRDEFLRMVHAWTSTRTVSEIEEEASLWRIPVAPIGTPASVTALTHFVERGAFVQRDELGFVQPRVPWKVSGVEPRPFGAPPRLGEHQGTIDWDAPRRTPPLGGRASTPLDGIRVIDLTAFWAGPTATQLFAALGADVVKVESTRRPDGARFMSTKAPPDESWWEWSPTFQVVNTNKRSVTLDLSTENGRAWFFKLLATADVLIENFSPRVLDSFGITWPVVNAANPRLVMVRMPAFGLDGIWRDRPGFAQTMEQVSGMAWQTGYADGPPVIPRGFCDPLAGMHAAFVTVAALRERARSGVGHLVESAMIEAALNVAAEPLLDFSATGEMATRRGNRSRVNAPRGVYRCAGADEWVAIEIENDAQWAALVDIAGLRDEVAPLGSRLDVRARHEHHDRIDAVLARWTSTNDAADLADRLTRSGVPAARVVPPDEHLDNPQHRARGFVEMIDHPVIGRHEVPGLPFRSSAHEGAWLRNRAPLIGEHTRDILESLNNGPLPDWDELVASGVIGDRPHGA